MGSRRKKQRSRKSRVAPTSGFSRGKGILVGGSLIVVCLLAFAWQWYGQRGEPARPDTSSNTLASRVEALEDERKRLDETVWSDEVLAREHESTFTRLWDDLRAASDKFAILGEFSFGRLVLGEAGSGRSVDLGIRVTPYRGTDRQLTPEELREVLAGFERQGYRIVQTEWHHKAFEAGGADPARSTVSAVLHVANDERQQRLVIKSDLAIQWSTQRDPGGNWVPETIEVRQAELIERTGAVPFQAPMTLAPDPADPGTNIANPVLLYDLDHDGLPEIVVAGRNRILWNDGQGRFREEQLCPQEPHVVNTAVIADLTGDARADFVFVDWRGRLQLLAGDDQGRFPGPPRRCWSGGFKLPSVTTAGDIDGDGDLDLWIGQYKQPYLQGQMPTPYFDANDGNPAFLLENDGSGAFTDVTESAGLAKKRFRRTYGASLVDLDEDGAVDLLVTSDFSGIDIYRGDGKGRFRDVTDAMVRLRHNFGMSHTFGDYDGDGRLDFYLVGMSSTTARRLDLMGLGHGKDDEVRKMRGRMGYGNRMYLARDGRFESAYFNDEVARSGWSWGMRTGGPIWWSSTTGCARDPGSSKPCGCSPTG